MTRTQTVVANNVTMVAGAGNVTTAGPDITITSYPVIILMRITNGATGPSVVAQIAVRISLDNTNFFTLFTFRGLPNNADVREISLELPLGTKYVQFVSGSNTLQNTTMRIEAGLLS